MTIPDNAIRVKALSRFHLNRKLAIYRAWDGIWLLDPGDPSMGHGVLGLCFSPDIVPEIVAALQAAAQEDPNDACRVEREVRGGRARP